MTFDVFQPGVQRLNSWLSRRQRGLLVFAMVGLAAYAGMVRVHLLHGTLRDEYTPQFIAWYALAFVAYVGALVWAEKRSASMRLVWGAAIAFRLLLLVTTPTLSDDVYRYMWDGHVANNGVSPYALPIDSPELDYLDVPVRAQANNKWMASPYMPAAQWLFAGLTRLFPLHPVVFQSAMLVFDLVSGVLIARLLAIAGLPSRRLLIYLWNPLVIVETVHGAHVDAWMLVLTLLALRLALEQFSEERWNIARASLRYSLSAIVFAAATLTKLLPLLLLPIMFWVWRRRDLLVYAVVAIALLIPPAMRAGWGLTGPLDGQGVFGAVRIYGDQWNFNSGLFHWLAMGLSDVGLVTPTTWAKGIVGALMLVVMTVVWYRARSRQTPRRILRLMALPFMAYILLTTTVHPWYLIILLAFLPFLAPASDESSRRWLLLIPWLYLSGAVALSYLTYLDPNNFREYDWVRRIEWLPTLLFLCAGWVWWQHNYDREYVAASQSEG